MKNADNPDSPYAGLYESSHRLLRVMEAVKAEDGDAVIDSLYRQYGKRVHVDQDLNFDPAEALVESRPQQALRGRGRRSFVRRNHRSRNG